jgi:hypothetical protein
LEIIYACGCTQKDGVESCKPEQQLLRKSRRTVYNNVKNKVSFAFGYGMTNQLHPIWFRLPKRFYRKLELSAMSAGVSAEDALEFAIDVFGRFVIAAQANTTDVKEFVARIWSPLRALQKDSAANQVHVMQAMEDAVKLYHIYGPIAANLPRQGDTSVRKSPAALAILRWAKIPPEERSQRARELALKRWNPKKGRSKVAGGKRER